MQQLGVRVFVFRMATLRPQFSPVCQTAKLRAVRYWWRAGRRGFCGGDPRLDGDMNGRLLARHDVKGDNERIVALASRSWHAAKQWASKR